MYIKTLEKDDKGTAQVECFISLEHCWWNPHSQCTFYKVCKDIYLLYRALFLLKYS